MRINTTPVRSSSQRFQCAMNPPAPAILRQQGNTRHSGAKKRASRQKPSLNGTSVQYPRVLFLPVVSAIVKLHELERGLLLHDAQDFWDVESRLDPRPL